jgi:hypothetical protein
MFLIFLPFVLAALFWFIVLIRESKPPTPPTPVDPEQAVRAAVELHRIRRNLDVAWSKSEQRREGAALRREIAVALDCDKDKP